MRKIYKGSIYEATWCDGFMNGLARHITELDYRISLYQDHACIASLVFLHDLTLDSYRDPNKLLEDFKPLENRKNGIDK